MVIDTNFTFNFFSDHLFKTVLLGHIFITVLKSLFFGLWQFNTNFTGQSMPHKNSQNTLAKSTLKIYLEFFGKNYRSLSDWKSGNPESTLPNSTSDPKGRGLTLSLYYLKTI